MREMKSSGIDWIGEIPADWNIKRLKQILQERNEKNNPIKSTNLLSLSIERGVFPYSEKTGGGNKAKENFEDYKLTYPNDIVLNSMNVVVGAVGKSNYFGCISPVYYTLFSRNDNYNIDYYNDIFQSEAFQKSLWGLGNGIVVKESDNGKLNTIRMRIPMEKLNNILLPVPTREEQDKIDEFLNGKITEIDNVIKKTKQTIEDYKLYKQSIITKAVTKGLNETVEMKDSGIEWIGKIPKNYNIKKIKHLGNARNGLTYSPENICGESEGTLVLRSSNILDGKLTFSDNVYVNIEIPDELMVNKDDILLCSRNGSAKLIGKNAIIEKNMRASFGAFMMIFKPKKRINSKYIKYIIFWIQMFLNIIWLLF